MGMYIIFLYCGNSVLSLVSGYVVEGNIPPSEIPLLINLRLVGAGWRWFCWLCAILSGVNFLGIFLFVHETRFNRIDDRASSAHEASDSEKDLPQAIEQKPTLFVSTTEVIGEKKTFLENLKFWSGTGNESYFSHFLRPFLLITYPAVVWGVIACKLYISRPILTSADCLYRLSLLGLADRLEYVEFFHLSGATIQFQPRNQWAN